MHCNNVYEQTKNTCDFSCVYSWFLLWNKYVETILKRTFVWYNEDRIERRKTRFQWKTSVRELYRAGTYIFMNSDVNGAVTILRKWTHTYALVAKKRIRMVEIWKLKHIESFCFNEEEFKLVKK